MCHKILSKNPLEILYKYNILLFVLVVVCICVVRKGQISSGAIHESTFRPTKSNTEKVWLLCAIKIELIARVIAACTL